jgi:hypothetical protein
MTNCGDHAQYFADAPQHKQQLAKCTQLCVDTTDHLVKKVSVVDDNRACLCTYEDGGTGSFRIDDYAPKETYVTFPNGSARIAEPCDGCWWDGECRSCKKYPYANRERCEFANKGVWMGNSDACVNGRIFNTELPNRGARAEATGAANGAQTGQDKCVGCWLENGQCRSCENYPYDNKKLCNSHQGIWTHTSNLCTVDPSNSGDKPTPFPPTH